MYAMAIEACYSFFNYFHSDSLNINKIMFVAINTIMF